MPSRVVRRIIEIDEEKCDGCGLCIPSCMEGALQIVDGKARLVKDQYCDGLGACLGECPQGALTIVEREAEEYNEVALTAHAHKMRHAEAPRTEVAASSGVPESGACPSVRVAQRAPSEPTMSAERAEPLPSSLSHWPVQLKLVPANAPFLQGADLLIAADCVPFAFADFHRKFLGGKAVVVACPKLDDIGFYYEKLAALFQESDIRSATVVRMEVPCCAGLTEVVRSALAASGRTLPLTEAIVSISGEALAQRTLTE